MKEVVVDASMMAAVAFKEPGWEDVLTALDGHRLHAPELLTYELANIAWKKAQRQPGAASGMMAALELVLDLRTGITLHSVHGPDLVLISQTFGISGYDASYIWLAGWLGADLMTLDRRLAQASARVQEL